ncbi:MAG: hypothetical protein LE168_05435 [Endomicrobium sp.]|nr:hypothetical protein [Endomicrobium sp.]
MTDSQDSTDAKVASLCSLTDKGKRACAENPNLSSYCKLSTEEQERVCADSCLKYPTKPYCNINALQNEHENSDRKQDKPQSSGWSTKTWVIGSVVVGIVLVAVVAGVVVYIRGGRAFDKMLGIDRTINSYPVKFHMWISNLFRHRRYGFSPIPKPIPLLLDELRRNGMAIVPETPNSRKFVEGVLAKDPKGFPYDLNDPPIDVGHYMKTCASERNILKIFPSIYKLDSSNKFLINNLALPETREDAVQEIKAITEEQKRIRYCQPHFLSVGDDTFVAMFERIRQKYLGGRRILLLEAIESSYYPTSG